MQIILFIRWGSEGWGGGRNAKIVAMGESLRQL